MLSHNTLAKLDSMVESHMQKNHITGAAVAVVSGDEILYARGYGQESILADSPAVTADTLFRIASVTKPLTGTMILQLVERGVLDLDMPIRTYLPWLELSEPGAAELLTLRLLLSHRSGFPTGGEPMGSRDPEGLERYVREYVPTIPLMSAPGVGYHYSNHNLNLAGYVAEAVTGTHFSKLMQELVFEPLEMTNTTFDPLVALSSPLARPHVRKADGTWEVSRTFLEGVANYPAWYCMSSANDLAKFARFHLQGGSIPSQMQAPQTPGYRVSDFACGLTWFRDSKRGKVRFYHFGQFSNQYESLLVFSPEDQIGLVVLGNGDQLYGLGLEMFDVLRFGEVVPEPEPVVDESAANSAEWPHYVGTYFSNLHGPVEVLTEGHDLLLNIHGEKMTLSPLRERVYFTQNADGALYSVGFPVEDESPVRGIILNGHVRGRREIPVYEANPAEWADWIGVYDDTVEQYEVDVRDGKLSVADSGREHEFEALAKDVFLSKTQGLIRFAYFGEEKQPTLVFHEAWRYRKVR
ncbi:beta-lactamase family protein [Tumebacillus sp. ITR2]|uniref:Beta-lactamase family protein n=1 Tax=Tumebacillus amylolyticus TaxID=2801339 RepID=A0ABS1J4P9_9BACL|nr:serine hydrolase domain-containing protein [Tumebacillus amylolyticus]MBL0385207.1 beta-lactamase family protein [Tumebacillus amylolyticus]